MREGQSQSTDTWTTSQHTSTLRPPRHTRMTGWQWQPRQFHTTQLRWQTPLPPAHHHTCGAHAPRPPPATANEEACPICLMAIHDMATGPMSRFHWPHCRHTYHTGCAAHMVVQRPRPPCPTCRHPWNDDSDAHFQTHCRQHGVELTTAPFDSDRHTRAPTRQPPAPPAHIQASCCPPLLLADPARPNQDSAWRELSDRHMSWAPTHDQQTDTWRLVEMQQYPRPRTPPLSQHPRATHLRPPRPPQPPRGSPSKYPRVGMPPPSSYVQNRDATSPTRRGPRPPSDSRTECNTTTLDEPRATRPTSRGSTHPQLALRPAHSSSNPAAATCSTGSMAELRKHGGNMANIRGTHAGSTANPLATIPSYLGNSPACGCWRRTAPHTGREDAAWPHLSSRLAATTGDFSALAMGSKLGTTWYNKRRGTSQPQPRRRCSTPILGNKKHQLSPPSPRTGQPSRALRQKDHQLRHRHVPQKKPQQQQQRQPHFHHFHHFHHHHRHHWHKQHQQQQSKEWHGATNRRHHSPAPNTLGTATCHRANRASAHSRWHGPTPLGQPPNVTSLTPARWRQHCGGTSPQSLHVHNTTAVLTWACQGGTSLCLRDDMHRTDRARVHTGLETLAPPSPHAAPPAARHTNHPQTRVARTNSSIPTGKLAGTTCSSPHVRTARHPRRRAHRNNQQRTPSRKSPAPGPPRGAICSPAGLDSSRPSTRNRDNPCPTAGPTAPAAATLPSHRGGHAPVSARHRPPSPRKQIHHGTAQVAQRSSTRAIRPHGRNVAACFGWWHHHYTFRWNMPSARTSTTASFHHPSHRPRTHGRHTKAERQCSRARGRGFAPPGGGSYNGTTFRDLYPHGLQPIPICIVHTGGNRSSGARPDHGHPNKPYQHHPVHWRDRGVWHYFTHKHARGAAQDPRSKPVSPLRAAVVCPAIPICMARHPGPSTHNHPGWGRRARRPPHARIVLHRPTCGLGSRPSPTAPRGGVTRLPRRRVRGGSTQPGPAGLRAACPPPPHPRPHPAQQRENPLVEPSRPTTSQHRGFRKQHVGWKPGFAKRVTRTHHFGRAGGFHGVCTSTAPAHSREPRHSATTTAAPQRFASFLAPLVVHSKPTQELLATATPAQHSHLCTNTWRGRHRLPSPAPRTTGHASTSTGQSAPAPCSRRIGLGAGHITSCSSTLGFMGRCPPSPTAAGATHSGRSTAPFFPPNHCPTRTPSGRRSPANIGRGRLGTTHLGTTCSRTCPTGRAQLPRRSCAARMATTCNKASVGPSSGRTVPNLSKPWTHQGKPCWTPNPALTQGGPSPPFRIPRMPSTRRTSFGCSYSGADSLWLNVPAGAVAMLTPLATTARPAAGLGYWEAEGSPSSKRQHVCAAKRAQGSPCTPEWLTWTSRPSAKSMTDA